MTNTPNIIYHDHDTDTTCVVVTQRNGSRHEIIMDSWVFCLFPGVSFHVKPMKHGMNKFYAALYLDGKLTYLHQYLGAGSLEIAATYKDNDRNTIDHKNRNSLDCRFKNLRAASMKEQIANRDSSTKKSKANE